MIQAIIFDLDDTLYDYTALHPGALAALEEYTCERYRVAKDQFRISFSAAREETKQLLADTAASHNRLLYCQKTLEHLDVGPIDGALEMYDIYWSYILKHMALREGAAELLAACKEQGIRIGICSDLTAHIQHRKLRALGIASLVDGLVTSEEAGAEKPDPRMFAMILKKLGCKPDQALYIGDNLERDIFGAERFGISALWLGGTGRDNAITTFKEVRTLLKWQ